ncbi:hypothetical protein BDN72DRAFT_851369 [Pluteus cervinus]|uniref:Uncharacterized protein n=1 Tax=Pluteus cervinus TaxID=181527 RepID=A0ACD3A0B0_9AGAR|nr:hypothetical protein BDN72DRAFT_851369 [Pluteus cervinus]
MDRSTIRTRNPVFYNTINYLPSSSKRTKHRSPKDAAVRGDLAKRAVRGASFDAAERGNPPRCHPDTRKAIQNSLVAWRSNRAAGPVRLISGWAGTGKTTIAQTMAEYWARQGHLAGSFFFSRSSKDRSETIWVPTTFLHQFLQIFGEGVDVGHLTIPVFWSELVDVLVSASPSLPQPLVIVIDGLDECHSTNSQVLLLRQILESSDRLGSSIKLLISCRSDRHLENVFHEFTHKLDPSYRIHLGQSEGDKNDIRTYFQFSFIRICWDCSQDGAMSITDGPWPSQEEVEWLVDRASGQFIFAATVVRFAGDENEDPVEMLNLVLEQRTPSFETIDLLYLMILERVGVMVDKGDKSLERQQMMQNLLLHVNYKPSSSLAIADFWFEKEVTINILVRHLQALLVRNPNSHGQDSDIVIQFRHKSFHDFLARPSKSHPFSFSGMNPVSKFFFSLRTCAGKVASHRGGWALQPSQWLGYAFCCCGDRAPVVFPYEDKAQRLHRAYSQYRPTFRGCICVPLLEPFMTKSDMSAVHTFKSCGRDDCIINSDLLMLCQALTVAMSVDHFIREWKEQERSRPFLFRILTVLLWFRVMLHGLLSDPLPTFYGTIQALMSGSSSLSLLAHCIAVVNGLFCIMILLNTRCDVVLLLYLSHIVATFLLYRFLRFDALRMDRSHT